MTGWMEGSRVSLEGHRKVSKASAADLLSKEFHKPKKLILTPHLYNYSDDELKAK